MTRAMRGRRGGREALLRPAEDVINRGGWQHHSARPAAGFGSDGVEVTRRDALAHLLDQPFEGNVLGPRDMPLRAHFN